MSETISPQEAALEVLRRQRARDSLVEFSRCIEIPGVPLADEAAPDASQKAWGGDSAEYEVYRPVRYQPIEQDVALHHRVTMAAIQRCIETLNGRLMIFEPPGAAKSTYGSVVAPAWAMGRRQNYQVLVTSYGTNIAVKQSRRCRSICQQPEYSAIWKDNPTLMKDRRANNDWGMTTGSELMAAGILAGITGNRANLVVIDDPVANREAADSPTLRQKTYDEYIDTILSRLKPGGSIILIQTRWHEEDLAGSILPEKYNGESGMIKCRDGQTWEVLCIPAKAEYVNDPLGRKEGEYLWVEWFGTDHWKKWENNPRAARTWAALCQQRPAPIAGIHFTREMFKWYDPDRVPGDENARPDGLRLYGASDYATMKEEVGKDPDFTEHGVAGIDRRGNLYIVDWWHGQKETDKSIDAFIGLLRRNKRPGRPIIRWWNEGGVIDKAIKPAIRRAMREGQSFVVCEALPSILDKGAKLLAFHARASAGTVYLPLKRPWATRLVDLLVGFPAARYDDGPDVCGLLGRGIDQMIEAVPEIPERKPALVPFSQAWLEYDDNADKPAVRYFS